MTRFLYAAAIATFLSAPALAAEVKFPLTGDNTKIKYTGSKPGGKHDGDFKKLSGFATVTPSDPTTLKIELEIEMDSLSSDNPALTGHLKNPDFFNVKVNPKAIFKSTKIVKAEKGYTITGDLTMCGKTKEVSFPAAIGASETGFTLTSSCTIDRSQWGVGATIPKEKVAHEVALVIAVDAKK